MDLTIFGWVGHASDEPGTELLALGKSHPGFDAPELGFDTGGQNTTVGSIRMNNGEGTVTQEWVGLLFDRGKTGVEVEVHDLRWGGVKHTRCVDALHIGYVEISLVDHR